MSDSLKKKSINSFIWKTAQSICSLGMTFVIQIILARILSPEDFGIVAITTVFMTLANTIVETSFSSAVIQRNSLDQKVLSSIFYANLGLSIAVYLVLYLIAPIVSSFYNEKVLVAILRVQGLRVVLSALYSIQMSLLYRDMKYKTMFFCSFAGAIVHGVVGVVMAYAGFGVWALIISTLANYCTAGVLMAIVSKWLPSLCFSYNSIKDSLSFSSKVLAIRVIRKLFYNIRALAIGKVYSTDVLGYFNKGFQFPSTAMTVIDGSLTSVAFTSLAKLQTEPQKLTRMLRQYVRIMMYLSTPMMIGMALVAKPLVVVLLTEKWLDCVPFLQIVCLTQLLVPLNVKTTAFEAMGDSGASMKLHVASVVLSILLLLLCIPFPAWVMVLSGFISSVILQIAVTIVSKRKLGYGYFDQFKDMAIAVVPTIMMTLGIVCCDFINLGAFAGLLIKVIVGVVLFVAASAITKNSCFTWLVGIIKAKIMKR